MSSRDDETSQVPDQLMDQLLKGYDSLHAEFKLLNDQRRELERKLAWAKQQYTDVLKRYMPETEPAESKTFLEELEEAGACQQNGRIDWVEHLSMNEDADRRTRAFSIRIADDAREKLRTRQSEISGVKIWTHRSAEKRGSVSSKLRNELEKDFTVPGTPSRLGCPFAVPGGDIVSVGRRSLPTPKSSAASRVSGSTAARRRSSLLDPIKGELCGNNQASPAVSEHDSAPLCPIRFMDQHSPEEVAEYFEKHKHQIPRSHQVCIKRYQSNEESIRQLDAKYGNLVSMIQGLGQKHQPILAEKDPDAEDIEEDSKNQSVDRWAKAVSASLQDEDIQVEGNEEPDDRKAHFDRPMKEIRVGESPSRPWGITVPSKFQVTESAASEASAMTASPQELSAPPQFEAVDGVVEAEPPARRCPIDHTKFTTLTQKPPAHSIPPQAAPVVIDPHSKPAKPEESDAARPQMLFTGPVFIGYPTEQAIQLLRESGMGSK